MSAVVHKRSLLFLSLCDFPLSLPLIRGPGQLCISVWQVYHQTISQLHFRPGRVNRSIWTENCQITYLMHAWCSKHSTLKARFMRGPRSSVPAAVCDGKWIRSGNYASGNLVPPLPYLSNTLMTQEGADYQSDFCLAKPFHPGFYRQIQEY